MTPEAQRIAIAEASGWINQGRAKNIVGLGHRWLKPGTRNHFVSTNELPDYLNDLNAIHAAIRTQKPYLKWAVFTELAIIVDADIPPAFGTAEEYSKAFLRTLKLWDDSK